MNDKPKRNIYRKIADRSPKLDDLRKNIFSDYDEMFVTDVVYDEPQLENDYCVPSKFKELNRFFNGQLTEADVIRFLDHEPTHDSNQGRYGSMTDRIRIPPHCDVVVLWQWDENSPVFSLYMPKPFVDNKLQNIIPRQYLAKRVAIMAMAYDHVSINFMYMLTGVVSKDDPIHEEIRKHGR